MGGMQVMALRIADHLSESHRVTVCTTAAPRPNYGNFQILNNLRARTDEDVKALNQVDVDIWLAMNAGYAAIAERLSKPVVAYFHGNDFLNPWVVSTPLPMKILSKMPLIGQFWRGKRRTYAQRKIGVGIESLADVLTNSLNTEEIIRVRYPQCSHVSLCFPGVEDRFFQDERENDSNSRVINLLTVSRLQKATRRKNVDGILQALARLKGKLDFAYSIVGHGDDMENLKSLSGSLGLSDRVTFHGRVGDDELLRLYRWANLFVLPAKSSPTDVEGFGIVYLEANASGVPVLCSAAGGALDAVVDGRTGIVIPGSDPDQIAAGIQRFVDTRANFQTNDLREFARRFTWKIAAARIESQILNSYDSFVERTQSEHSVGMNRIASRAITTG
jgi:glycosyltransferase involved in cell wall biosynthesis